MPNNGSNVYTHHHTQSYNMGDYNSGQQPPSYNNQYVGYAQQPQPNQQNPVYKANNFFSNNQQNNNIRPVQQPINIRQPSPMNNYSNHTQNMQNPYNQQEYRPQQSF